MSGQYPSQGPGGPPPGHYQQQQPPPKKTGLILGIIALVVALIAVGIAAFLVLGDDDGDDVAIDGVESFEQVPAPVTPAPASPMPTATAAPTPTATATATATPTPTPTPAPTPSPTPPPPPPPSPTPQVDQEFEVEIVAQVFWDDGSDFDARLITPDGTVIPADSDTPAECGALPPQEESVSHIGGDGSYTLEVDLFRSCNQVDGSFAYEIYIDGQLRDSGSLTINDGDTAAIDFDL